MPISMEIRRETRTDHLIQNPWSKLGSSTSKPQLNPPIRL